MKIKEFLDMKFKEKKHTFDSKWLIELQKEIRERYPKDFWSSVDRTKLNDCQKDKEAILNELKQLLGKWYEAEIIIRDNPNSEFEDDEGNDEKEDSDK